MNYDTITDRVSSVNKPAGSMVLGTCTPSWGAFPPMDPPVSSVGNFEPLVTQRIVYDPSKGREFSKLKKSGHILFSIYQNSEITTRESLSSVPREQVVAYQLALACLASPPVCHVAPLELLRSSWTEKFDFSSLSKKLLTKGKMRSEFKREIADAISSTQQSAFNDALNAYDVLTEVGELSETITYLSSKVKGGADLLASFARTDEKDWTRARRFSPKMLLRSSDRGLRELGARWMEYRYALMPIVYSIKDVMKVHQEKAYQFQTDRSKEKIDLAGAYNTAFDTEVLFWESSGEAIVRSATKARFDLGELQKLATVVGMNPFRTAWELIPLSFVVDWFLNVGDAITSLTGIDWSSGRNGYTSVRERSEFRCHHYVRDSYVYTKNGFTNACGAVIPPFEYVKLIDVDHVVKTVTIDSYERTLWSKPTPKIVFNPFLNWKRAIDGIVLANRPVIKSLRSLR